MPRATGGAARAAEARALTEAPGNRYLAAPRRGSPGVLVLHAWWGLTDGVRDYCDRLARAGFVALAPDLFDGRTATTEPAARALREASMRGRREPAYRVLLRELEALAARATGDRLGVVGFSMGGHWALLLAQRAGRPIGATVVHYAVRGGDYGASRSGLLVHLADDDPWVSTAARECPRRSTTIRARGTGSASGTGPSTTRAPRRSRGGGR